MTAPFSEEPAGPPARNGFHLFSGIRRFAFLPALVAALLTPGCSEEPPRENEFPGISRLIDTEPAAVFRPDDLIDSESVLDWKREECLIRQGWEINLPEGEFSCDSNALRLEPSKLYVTLIREVDIVAQDVHAIDIVAHGLARQRVGIQWAKENEGFNDHRLVEGSIRADPKGGPGTARLRVHGRDGWEGRIRRIQIYFIIPRHGKARIESLTAVRERVVEERLEQAAKKQWKIEINDDLRNGVIGAPQFPIRWATDAPPSSRLYFTFGTLGFCRDGFQFQVTSVDRLSTKTLFSRKLDCSTPGWHEASVPLSSEERHTLEFSTRPLGDGASTMALPVWANIEVVGTDKVERPNIVLISVDTLRADHLSIYGYPRPTSPRLEEWSRSGAVVFDRVVAPSPWTLPSHTSIFTGLDAHRHGVNHGSGLPDSLVTVAEVLRGAGYTTRAVTAGGFVHQQYGFAQGFDVYSSMSMRMGFDNELEVGLKRAQEALERVDGRSFLLFFHTYEVHNPFRPRQPYFTALTGRDGEEIVDVEVLPPQPDNGFLARRELKILGSEDPESSTKEETRKLAADLYDSSIAYTDGKLDELFRSIDDLGLSDRTVVILTSDHGELFGEHDLVNHVSLYDENVMVPLVVLDRRLGPGIRRVSQMVRSVDLFPTILEIAGVANEHDIHGRSLVAMIEGGRSELPDEDAWSYASNSNYGISLRTDDGSTAIFRNDAWVSTGGREEFFGQPEGNGDGQVEVFRNRIESELEDAQPGLRIRCRNESDRAFTIRLRGSLVQPARIKLTEIMPGPLQRAADGSAILEVGPGMDLTLVLETLHFETIHLSVDHGDGSGPTHDLDLDVDDIGDGLWLGRQEGKAVTAQADTMDGDGVYLWLKGESNPDRKPVDDEVLEQLEALGYTH